MEVYDVQFLQEASDDVEEIVLYIAQDSRQAALRMHDQIVEKVNDLSVFPKRGRLVPDKKMAEAGYRVLGIKKLYSTPPTAPFRSDFCHFSLPPPCLPYWQAASEPPQLAKICREKSPLSELNTVSKPYLAFYRIVGCNVFIYRVLHGAMNYPLLYEKFVQDSGKEF